MDRRIDWALRRRWLPLNGGHRALDDCQTAYELLCAITSPSHNPTKRDR
jgi:DNA polymerase III epsilon subunit-like protein